MTPRISTLFAILLLAACNETKAPTPTAETSGGPEADIPAPVQRTPAAIPAEATPMIGEAIARAEWRTADNRAGCAPLALRSDGGAGGTSRRAQFAGGWGVAFDTPRLRSAYGYAGVGALPDDGDEFSAKVDRLDRQWPLMRRWGPGQNLPEGTAAGFGVEGASPYPDDNPRGRGLHSVAYVHIPGQSCLYNVWSRLSRDHLESILGNLILLDTDKN